MKKLDIVIVNWNSGDQLRSCLNSIAKAQKTNFDLSRVVVVDNASTDDSTYHLDLYKLPITIIRNVINIGFARACNQGAKGSEADYLLFLNPDIVLFDDSLSLAVAFMDRKGNEKIGICGIQLVDRNGNVARTCARFPQVRHYFFKLLGLNYFFPGIFHCHFMKEWDHCNNSCVDQVMGAFFLVRKNLFDRLEGFDENFFLYFEEVDFSLRARQLGYMTFFLAETRAYHKGGGTSEKVKAKRLYYFMRSQLIYGRKYYRKPALAMLILCMIILEPISRIVLGLVHRSNKEINECLKGYIMFLKSLFA
jgi:GT2 family glycosyltransferase